MIVQGKVWGETSPIFTHNNIELHYVKINAGGYCSKHLHKHKYNRFTMIRGKLKVTIWNEYANETLEDVSIISAGQECTVPPGKYHRFEALENCELLEIYWVDLDCNDIVRADHGGMQGAPQTNICTEATRKNDSARNLGSNQGIVQAHDKECLCTQCWWKRTNRDHSREPAKRDFPLATDFLGEPQGFIPFTQESQR